MSATDSSGAINKLPDIMNDPAFDPIPDGKRKKSVDEADTCRICRSEGAKDEPLFYPCKCSGSIKFVHQHCLMEWLSHSQKKHCELCKTPFRFTKLYHPQMPATVPTLVFLRQVLIHTWRSFIATSRLHLVAFVWLCWLPWSMRTVWRGLFWLGDGGWIDWAQMENEVLRASKARMDRLAAEGSSPVPHEFFPPGVAAASRVMARIADAFPQMASQTLNLTVGKPVVFGLARALFNDIMGAGRVNSTLVVSSASIANLTQVSSIPYRSSWLSDIGFLKTLTSYPILNNVVIDTLEGQIITMFIVIAFILIFLIREWVVQQQPAVNLQAGAQAPEPIPAVEDGNIEVDDRAGHMNHEHEAPIEAIDAGHDWDDGVSPVEEDSQHHQLTDMGGQETSDDQAESNVASQRNPAAPLYTDPEKTIAVNHDSTDHQQRPSMPDRGTLARAAEIRRTIEEQSRIEGPDWPGLTILMDLWTRAENEPGRVLRIIREEGRGEELAWVAATMRRLENIPLTARDQSGPQSAASAEDPTPGESLQANVASRDVEGHDTDIARMIHDSDFDLVNGLGATDSLDDASNLTERGSSVPIVVPDGDDTSNDALEEDLDSSELSRTGSISTNQLEDPVLVPQAHESTAHVNNNPFHPDYTGPLPSEPHDESAIGQTASATDPVDANPHTTEPNPPTQSDGIQATSTGLGVSEGLIDQIMTWLWGEARPSTTPNNDQAAADVELIVQDLANEAPFVPMEHGQPMLDDHHDNDGEMDMQGAAQDPEAVADAVQAGLDPIDPEAIEEIEDLEGVMELIGMQGPIAGLIQNCMFCAVLVSLTIFLAIWVPYTLGKLFLIVLTSPVSLLCKMPFWYAQALADFFSDAVVFIVTFAYYWVATVVDILCSPLRKIQVVSYLLHGDEILAGIAWGYASESRTRLGNTLSAMFDGLSESDFPTFSIIAHESLRSLLQQVSWTGQLLASAATAACTWRTSSAQVFGYLKTFYGNEELAVYSTAKNWLSWDALKAGLKTGFTSLASLRHFNIFRVNVTIPPRTHLPDFTLAYWDTKDRALAILFGYVFLALLGVAYLWMSPLFQNRRRAEKVDGIMAEILYQAGGVLKVILIISIEMIVFPLYCGLLLDVALLPLFSNVTLLSRLEFMVNSPYTSLFVHWFVGTCYMFHFALFVSMCRKIMRTGVLYFIRDPDDPTFHPVRDVLERSVFTQLCKIAFSALVYGGLVMVCLGSVVWGISSAFDGIFPIHWSSNEPVLEFPVDLLFYNFVMPLAVKVLKPSKGLTKMYGWWFRACARGLRLSHFLFGDKREDEEGRHVRRTWRGAFARQRGDTKNPVIGKEQQQSAEDRGLDAYFLRDGRYVRTPSSDQVRIPKGAHTFLEVDEAGNRVDGKADDDEGLHGRNNSQFETIYIPPHFRLRVCAFLGLLWLFAAATGACFTLIPLVFGRYVFSSIFPSHPRMNDIYAFCIGVNILGGTGFALLNARSIFNHLRHITIHTSGSNGPRIFKWIFHLAVRLARVVYTYTAFGFLLPSLVALAVELYFIVPLHTFFSTSVTDRHIIHFIQDWTLGVLYIKMIGRFILWFEGSRAAIALRNITRNGWTDPNIRLATRGFIFPATVLLSMLLLIPLGAGWIANSSVMLNVDAANKSNVYRYSYPCFLALGIGMVAMYHAARAFKGWKRRIRDEVYLIGERLHNFGERKTPAVVGGNRVSM
ncbi:MAG: hypothetical protein Q9171_002046 [Xanthocarpia ochracea]